MNIKIEQKDDLSVFEHGMVVGVSVSEAADQLGFSYTAISGVYRRWSEEEKISSEQQISG